MSGLSVSFRAYRAGFFDSEKVKRQVDAATRKVLSKAGAFVRQRARTSIRKRKAVSAPGSPPSSHEGSLRRLIFFAYDAANNSMVVGPTAFGRGEVPRLLEFGGRTTLRRKAYSRPAAYRARPFMGPAGRAEAPKFKDLLRGMVN